MVSMLPHRVQSRNKDNSNSETVQYKTNVVNTSVMNRSDSSHSLHSLFSTSLCDIVIPYLLQSFCVHDMSYEDVCNQYNRDVVV